MPAEPILAIVSAAAPPSQDDARYSSAGLMAEAGAAVIKDAGIDKGDIDGLFSASSFYYMPTLNLSEYLGIVPKYSDSTTIGGCSFVAHLRHAAAAITAGEMTTGLIAYGSTQRSMGSRFVKSMSEPSPYEMAYGPLWPIAGYALQAQRHMHQFGTTPEQLAEVAVSARAWAGLNPAAMKREALEIGDVLASPMIATPLHRLDCCLVTDGGGALIVTSPERARDMCEDPIYLLAGAEGHFARYMSQLPDFVTSPGAITAPDALRKADVGLDDIDHFQIYDPFTIAVIMAVEDIGLCAKGEGGAFLEDRKSRPGGTLPINTNGGGLSHRHPGMLGMNLILEAVEQLRGIAGERQLPDAKMSLVHGLGGVYTTTATAVLANSDGIA
ncbi:MAG: acetyl-CoA acetyltransferase [Acidimicrobiia bacterium]|nr:acetyl-CoA acetyltransferase [Acidimicrobiia bacterium]